MSDFDSTPQSPVPGGRLGRYILERPIGAGGNAAVYRARDETGTRVAIKILHPETVKPDEIKRFKREFEALSRMDHPNIVRVYEADLADGYPWIAIEYVDGTDLGTLIETWKLKPPADHFEQVERILRRMCQALQYIHEQGLIHRDIKPSNVLIRSDGETKITDFGGVKDPEGHDTQLTIAGQLVGTVAFMAPEQITADPIDRRTDLYSLGALLYVMLTFRRPIEADSVAGFLARHLTEIPRAPSDIQPTIPRRLEQICQRLLMKDPAQRYPSARSVLQALDSDSDPDTLPLRGRIAELTQWTELLRRLKEGGGGSVAVYGPEGSGRTYLLQTMMEQARQDRFNIAFSPGTNPNPITEMLRDIGEEVSEVPTKKHLRWLAQRIRGHGWVLFVDDLDKSSPRIIEAYSRLIRKVIVNEGEPVLFVYTCRRTHGVLAGLSQGEDSGMPSETITITSMPRKAVVAMLRDRGLGGPIAAILGRRLHTQLNGLPNPITQQLTALVDADWLKRQGEIILPVKDRESFRSEPLPVPLAIRQQLTGRLAQLDSSGVAVAQTLALLNRPASAGLLARASGITETSTYTIQALVKSTFFRTIEHDDDVLYDFAHPCTSSVVVEQLAPERAREIHKAIAAGLGRRRRDPIATKEVAHHLLAAGDYAAAYPQFIQAAWGTSRAQRHSEVLAICEQAASIRANAEQEIPVAKHVRHSRKLFMLMGEALLAKGNWQQAVPVLEKAVQFARSDTDSSALARCLGSLGRAHYRLGRFDTASPLLQSALEHSTVGSLERAPATRALGDILVRKGDFDSAEGLWREALDIAREHGQRDAEARACRGLAHVRVFQGHLDEAADLLDHADDMLNPDGDPRVRASILARSVELDLAAGRLASAIYRSETLLDLIQTRDLISRIPEANALYAEALYAIGDTEKAYKSVCQVLTHARANPDPKHALARLTAARILCNLERYDELEEALPSPEELTNNAIDDPSAQLAALRSRAAISNPNKAIDLGHWCLVRPVPLLVIRHVRICTDLCLSLSAAGDLENAKKAAKRGLTTLRGPGLDGLRFELLGAFYQASKDERVLDAMTQVATRLLSHLPAHVGTLFKRRKWVQICLSDSP